MMVPLVALLASLLVVAESQVRDTAALANLKGFLPKYIEDFSAFSSEADASKTSFGNYNKVMSSLNRMKHGNGPDALSHRNQFVEHGVVGGSATSNMADRPSTISDSKQPTAKSVNSMPPVIMKGHGTLKVVERKTENREVEQMLHSQKANTDTALMAIGMTLLACATVLAVRLRRERQPALVLATGAGHGSDMLLSDSADHAMELKTQGCTTREEIESRQRSDATVEEPEAQHSAPPCQDDRGSSSASSTLKDTVVFHVDADPKSIHHINSPLNLTTVKEHGKLMSITNTAAIAGGARPFLLQDSDTLVEETLRKLGEISASSNQDSDEAIQVFSSMSYNKRNLRKVGMKSTEVKVPSSYLSVLRHAPLNNESAGTWQLATSDARVREYLIAQGLLSGKNPVVDREATKDDVFLKRHSRSLQLDDCKTSNDPQQNTNWKFTLCFLQILRCFGDRAWDFLLPVFIGSTVTQTLLPAAALDVFQTLGIVFLAPKIAMWYAERSTKGTAYVWLTFIKQIAITLLGALFVLGMPLLQEGEVNLMLPGVFGSILALTIASINTSLGNVVAKDWTAAFSKNSDELARANSMASASELAGAAAAPLCVRCLTGSFGFKSAFIILVLWQLATALISSVLALRLNRTPVEDLKPSAALGTEAAPDESRFSFEQCRKLAPDVRGAIMATVLLWCTVLGGSGAGFTAWLSQRISLSAIALWWSSMQFIGLLGASVAPALIKKLGSRKTARIAQTWQACFVLLAAVGFFTGRTILVLVAIAVSRLGVWCFDLAERQLVQEAVTASQRAPLFALETSASQCAHISILMVGLLFPAPSQFGILVALSATATTSACAILNTSLRGKRLSSPTAVAPLQSSPPHRLDIDAHRRHGVHLHSVRSRFDDLGEMRRAGQGDDGGADIYGDLGCEHVITM